MFSISIYQKYPLFKGEDEIKLRIKKVLKSHHVNADSQVSIAVVNENDMSNLSKKYLKEPGVIGKNHPVLSFPVSDLADSFVFPPSHKNYLGDIVISYPWVAQKAKKDKKTEQEVALMLIEHSILHLIGIHHE